MEINISTGTVPSKKKFVIYGTEGIGKSTFASKFPDPLFIDVEGGTKNMDVRRFADPPTSYAMLINYIDHIMQNAGICKTLVIDTIDWVERMIVNDVCTSHGKKGIEDFGYGNGYTYVAEKVGQFLNKLQELIDKNICNVVLIAHAQIKKFEQPNESGSYDRYELKLGKKTTSQTAPLVKEWCDALLFINYETFAVKQDKEGKKFKAQGGERVMYTTHHPCWDAKNRFGLPEKIPFDYSSVAFILDDKPAVTEHSDKKPAEPDISGPQKAENAPAVRQDKPAGTVQENSNEKFDLSDFEEISPALVIPDNIPKELQDLMRINKVSEEEIRRAVAMKGYYPENTPIGNYDKDFISGVLIEAWEQVYDLISGNRTPF